MRIRMGIQVSKMMRIQIQNTGLRYSGYLYERTCCSPRYCGICMRGHAVAREVWWYLRERMCCSPRCVGTCAVARGVVLPV
jgi:hypothetical protein